MDDKYIEEVVYNFIDWLTNESNIKKQDIPQNGIIFFKLRLAHDAQPEIQELARCMKKAMDESTPKILSPGEWHLPYVTEEERSTLDIEVLPKISGRRCARISYLNHDKSNPDVKADIARADELIAVEHLSPFEHQGTPIDDFYVSDSGPFSYAPVGVTHIDSKDERHYKARADAQDGV